jgi:hypothetical protein
MYAGRDFDTIDSNETPILTFDFAKYPFASGETITSVIWNCSVADFSSTTDSAPSSRLIGAASISGTKTLQQVGTMLDGVKYQLAAQATTSLGQILDLFSFALCQDRAKVT